jgi:hypothetical protein
MNPELLSDPHPRMLLSAILVAAPGSVRQLVERMEPLSPPAREVLSAARWEPCPATWLEVADRKRIRHNLTLLARLEICYRQVLRRCTDEQHRAEMRLTSRTARREVRQAFWGLLGVFLHLPINRTRMGQKSVKMANVDQHYVNAVLLVEEMVELMDDSCVPIIEDQFSHGT